MSAWWSRPKSKMKPEVAAKTKRSVPSGVFQKCDECGETVPSGQVKEALWCCPKCGHHFVMPTEERIKITVDEGSFAEEDRTIQPEDPLEFRDSKRYADRLRAAQKQVGTADAFREGRGDHRRAARCRSASSCSSSWAARWARWSARRSRALFERALARAACRRSSSRPRAARACRRAILSLMQMAKTTAALARLREAALPYISVLLHPTTGGVAASFAMLGDVIIAEPEGAHRLRRAARDRADDPAEAARRASSAPSSCSSTAWSTPSSSART